MLLSLESYVATGCYANMLPLTKMINFSFSCLLSGSGASSPPTCPSSPTPPSTTGTPVLSSLFHYESVSVCIKLQCCPMRWEPADIMVTALNFHLGLEKCMNDNGDKLFDSTYLSPLFLSCDCLVFRQVLFLCCVSSSFLSLAVRRMSACVLYFSLIIQIPWTPVLC